MTHFFWATASVTAFAVIFGFAVGRFLPHRKHEIVWWVGRTYYHVARVVCGVEVEVEGFNEYLADPSKNAVIVANHQDSLDIMVMGAFAPPGMTVMAKKSLSRVPLLGNYLRIVNTFFMDRANSAKDRETLAVAVKEMNANKRSLFVYPEGTRSHRPDRTMLPFKKGAFHVAVQAQVPIIPVVFSAYDDLFHTAGMKFRGGKVHVKILPPIPTAGISPDNKAAIDALVNEAHDTMLATLYAISPEPKTAIQPPSTPHARDRRTPNAIWLAEHHQHLVEAEAQQDLPTTGLTNLVPNPEDTLVLDQKLPSEVAYLDDYARSRPSSPERRPADDAAPVVIGQEAFMSSAVPPVPSLSMRISTKKSEDGGSSSSSSSSSESSSSDEEDGGERKPKSD
ncbi:hypothetical protein BCR44DRAFT_1386680 [Catenaria anguillulae PL171]|uniref:1-acyl-sn-glycerol-3-phosphate acyltransferase n=1 Tax=Catenaria anguillulae PL171 TaxID=765915 RepID=A0A1Y2HZK2_9FUNG|nr:hypothetical protein BCR44DRAFT_1386680 [Catenaria anguillulae PL171]